MCDTNGKCLRRSRGIALTGCQTLVKTMLMLQDSFGRALLIVRRYIRPLTGRDPQRMVAPSGYIPSDATLTNSSFPLKSLSYAQRRERVPQQSRSCNNREGPQVGISDDLSCGVPLSRVLSLCPSSQLRLASDARLSTRLRLDILVIGSNCFLLTKYHCRRIGRVG
jgi:hypothetical protein